MIIVSGVGATVSMVNTEEAGNESFPDASVVTTFMRCTPSGRAVVGVKLQSPELSTDPVPITEPLPLVIVNVVFGSHVPFIVGVLSFVTSPFVGLSIDGVAGTVVSIVTVTNSSLTNIATTQHVHEFLIEMVRGENGWGGSRNIKRKKR